MKTFRRSPSFNLVDFYKSSIHQSDDLTLVHTTILDKTIWSNYLVWAIVFTISLVDNQLEK